MGVRRSSTLPRFHSRGRLGKPPIPRPQPPPNSDPEPQPGSDPDVIPAIGPETEPEVTEPTPEPELMPM